jgi:hypothetical protein
MPVPAGLIGGSCMALNPQLVGPGRPVLYGVKNQ